MTRLENKVALVTGSTKGIGEAIAKRFAEEGASVVVHGRDEERGARVVADIGKAGGRAVFVRADITHAEDIAELVEATEREFGALHILVNNAAPTDLIAGGRERPILDQRAEDFTEILSGALVSVFLTCKHALPPMVRAGGGSIINISSLASIAGVGGTPSYSAAKGGLNALSRQLAVDYGPQGVRCNTLTLGLVMTDDTMTLLMSHPVARPVFEKAHLTRLGTPQDVANAALFLASDESAFVTGTMLVVDGGMSARAPMPDISEILAETAPGN